MNEKELAEILRNINLQLTSLATSLELIAKILESESARISD